MHSILRGFRNRKLVFAAGLIAALGLVFTGGGLMMHHASATPDCDSNSIIYCGFSTPGDFITDVNNNDSKNGHSDLKAIYAHQFDANKPESLTSDQYNDFAAHAVLGSTCKDGTVTVNGQQVASGAISVGRQAANQGSGYFTYPIPGVGTYYGNVNAKAFASNCLPVYILFDSQGTMTFAALQACGNPLFGNVVHTTESCNSLTATPSKTALNTYDFTASTTINGVATTSSSGNVTIKKYIYDFGDGTTKEVDSDFGQTVSHTYKTAGPFTAKVMEYVSVPGNDNLQLPVVAMCQKTITLPVLECAQLVPAIVDKSKYQYTFTATARYSTGVTADSADFDFGDGHIQKGVKPAADGKTFTVPYTYASASTYNLAAVIHFTVNGLPATSLHPCTAMVSPTTVTPTCKPGVPVGSPECLPPCQPGSSIPPGAAQCTPPSLPNTGAGNVIAIFAAVVVGGFLVYRQILFRKHKAAFAAAEQGTSALPLGDPLNADAPLDGTPLASKRRSFRRKRPF